MGLEALDAIGADLGRVERTGRELQPLPRTERDALATAVTEPECDRAGRADEHLVVGVDVCGVPVTGAVRP